MATTLKRIRLSALEVQVIASALRGFAKGPSWGLPTQQVEELADLIYSANAVIVTPSNQKD